MRGICVCVCVCVWWTGETSRRWAELEGAQRGRGLTRRSMCDNVAGGKTKSVMKRERWRVIGRGKVVF